MIKRIGWRRTPRWSKIVQKSLQRFHYLRAGNNPRFPPLHPPKHEQNQQRLMWCPLFSTFPNSDVSKTIEQLLFAADVHLPLLIFKTHLLIERNTNSRTNSIIQHWPYFLRIDTHRHRSQNQLYFPISSTYRCFMKWPISLY